MQARKFKVTKDFFGHGSIFKIDKLIFKDSKGKEHKFADFYPHTDMKGIVYAVICTQDCDIEQKKVTHLNVALLEPVQRPKTENPIRFLDLDFNSLVIPFNEMNFYSLAMFNQLTTKLEELVDNNNAHNMFVDLKGKCHFINLTKMYPIKFEHFSSIKEQAKFQLSGSFKHLLGWKLANLYGRVGVEVYPLMARKDLIKKILSSIGDSVESYWPKNSYSLTDDQLMEIKGQLGSYNAQKAKGRDVESQAKKIYEKLVEFGVAKPRTP